MSGCTIIIALAERLRGHSRVAWRRGRGEFAGDLRLAEHYLRRHAALLIADEAERERDPAPGAACGGSPHDAVRVASCVMWAPPG